MNFDLNLLNFELSFAAGPRLFIPLSFIQIALKLILRFETRCFIIRFFRLVVLRSNNGAISRFPMIVSSCEKESFLATGNNPRKP